MAARAVPLTLPRGLSGVGGIIGPLRWDIPDYGPPGNHFGGPWAKTKAFSPVSGILTGDDSPGGPEASACDRRGSFAAIAQPAIAAGATLVTTAKGGYGPAIIRQVEYWCELAVPVAAVQLVFKVAEDTDTTGGLLTTGTRIRDSVTAFDVNPMTQKITVYPNFIVTFSGPWNFKVVAVNGSAGVLTFETWASYDLLS